MSKEFCLAPEAVIQVNAYVQGVPTGNNVLDRGKLESALAAPLATFAGEYFYPTPLERAAALLHGVCKAHAFVDGNKRTAWLVAVSYLEGQGFALRQVEASVVAEFVVAVAVQGGRDLAPIAYRLATWLKDCNE